MPMEVRAPHFPESIEDGTLMVWHKQEGDDVVRDEKLAEIETDKVVLEVAAPANGRLTAILKQPGETVLDEEVLATVEPGAGGTAGTAETAPAIPEPAPAAEEQPAAPTTSATPAMSPSVRKLVTEHQLDPSSIPGTGKGGRITKADVLALLKQGAAPAPAAAPPAPAASTGADGRQEKRVPMSRLRARIAERLVAVQHETAMLTTFNEVNMRPVMDMRAKHRDAFEKEYGVKLGFMSFFVKASIGALKKFPSVNASIDGKDIVYHEYFDMGIAVSTERGLVVPVLRNADQLSFAAIEKEIGTYAERARENQLTLEDLSGGTFTITNGGVFGSLLSTPILNPPQSAILGMHRIQERPVAEDGQVVVRPMMYLALSYDHRIVDGREAVQFLLEIKDALEYPTRLLLEL